MQELGFEKIFSKTFLKCSRYEHFSVYHVKAESISEVVRT